MGQSKWQIEKYGAKINSCLVSAIRYLQNIPHCTVVEVIVSLHFDALLYAPLGVQGPAPQTGGAVHGHQSRRIWGPGSTAGQNACEFFATKTTAAQFTQIPHSSPSTTNWQVYIFYFHKHFKRSNKTVVTWRLNHRLCIWKCNANKSIWKLW